MPLKSPDKMQWYRRYPAYLRSDEAYMGLDALGHGILVGILDHQFANGSVPIDPEILGDIVEATPEQVRSFLSRFTKLRTLAELEGGPADRLANPFLFREMQQAHALIDARKQAGAKGGRKTQLQIRSSNAVPMLEAPLEPHSSRQNQEQEADKTQIQRDSSRQKRIYLGVNGHQAPIADAADGMTSLPEDIREGLSRLGIAANLGPDLCDRAGGTRRLRAALEMLDAKVQQKEIHSPSGFFLRCVEELAREGRALYDEAYEKATRSHRKALADRRWIQLPEACRESLEVLLAWCVWWTLQERLSSASSAMKDDHAIEVLDSWNSFLDICCRHHPQKKSIVASIEQKQEQLGAGSRNPGLARRVRMGVMEELLGMTDSTSLNNSNLGVVTA